MDRSRYHWKMLAISVSISGQKLMTCGSGLPKRPIYMRWWLSYETTPTRLAI